MGCWGNREISFLCSYLLYQGYFPMALLNSSASAWGYRLTRPAFSFMAATERGDGPSGFSFEPSLIIVSGSSPYFFAISSMDFPGTYSLISFTVGLTSSLNLIQHRHHCIKLLFCDGKRRDKTKD